LNFEKKERNSFVFYKGTIPEIHGQPTEAMSAAKCFLKWGGGLDFTFVSPYKSVLLCVFIKIGARNVTHPDTSPSIPVKPVAVDRLTRNGAFYSRQSL
jgi:hypothetical protein